MMSWADCAAYADWAALRPMTELEFEKACRGDQPAGSGEYPWGSLTITAATGITNSGAANEGATPASANCVYNNVLSGPLRAGVFATASSNRQSSGATYYGIMDMGGNEDERVINVGTNAGRAFNGTHGDGALDVNGVADATTWPSSATADGTGERGGQKGSIPDSFVRVSDRFSACNSILGRVSSVGGRAVRTAP